MEQRDRGLKTPGCSKTVLRMENAAAYAAPFLISAFAIAWATVDTRPYIALPRHGMFFRIML